MMKKRFFLTMTATIKNESPYLAEWIAYHILQGVEHIYIYDNFSSDNPLESIIDYVIQGYVTFIAWPEHPGQLSAYSHAINIFGRDTEWMIMIDVDEFIQTPPGQNITEILSRLDKEDDQLLLAWVHFGSSGHEEKPDGLVIENFIHRSVEAHRQTKFIVRPESVSLVGIHHCETRRGRTIDCSGQPAMERWIQPAPLPTAVRVNHYFTKSRAEFAAKIARGQADGGGGKTLADFNRFATPVLDRSLAEMGGRVRAAIEATRRRSRHYSVHAPWSAQSELVFSDQWHKAIRKGFASLTDGIPAHPAVELSITASEGSLRGLHRSSSASTLASSVQASVDAKLIMDLSGAEWPIDMSLDDTSNFGRPYLMWQGWSEKSTKITILVEGKDAGQKPWTSERSFSVDERGILIAITLSDRTICIDRIAIWHDEAARIKSSFSRIYTFI